MGHHQALYILLILILQSYVSHQKDLFIERIWQNIYCQSGDFSCYYSIMMRTVTESRYLLTPLTLDEYDELCSMYQDVEYCLNRLTDNKEFCGSDKGYFDNAELSTKAVGARWSLYMPMFKALCHDRTVYGKTVPCISNNLNRAQAHICLDLALLNDPEYFNNDLEDFTSYCPIFIGGWKCTWFLFNERCGEEVNLFLNEIRNATLTPLAIGYGCDIPDTVDFGTTTSTFAAIFIIFATLLAIPFAIRLTWCPQNIIDEDLDTMQWYIRKWNAEEKKKMKRFDIETHRM